MVPKGSGSEWDRKENCYNLKVQKEIRDVRLKQIFIYAIISNYNLKTFSQHELLSIYSFIQHLRKLILTPKYLN
jgi:hypothetical protein